MMVDETDLRLPVELLDSANTKIADLKSRLAEADVRNESLLMETVRLRDKLSMTAMLLEKARNSGARG